MCPSARGLSLWEAKRTNERTEPNEPWTLVLDILPAMNGRDSYGVPAGFAGISSVGSSRNRLTSAEDYEEALLSGYPPVGLLDASNIYHAEEKGNRLPRPAPGLPGLNAGACAHHGVNGAIRCDHADTPL